MKKQRVALIHWNQDEARELAGRLQTLGYETTTIVHMSPQVLRALAANPPDAFVIDLSRLPSHGREVAMHLRKQKRTRRVPIVFAGGLEPKVEQIRSFFPDAVYTSWDRIGPDLEHARSHPPANPKVPETVFDAYQHKPLWEKLGIRPGRVISLINAPHGFKDTLEIPVHGVIFRKDLKRRPDLVICFVRSRASLKLQVKKLAPVSEHAPVWIASPKKASGMATDLNQNIVRAAGLAAGMVDYKVCSIDETWTGLLFRIRSS
jgi:CheY-like chemotaxis protein